MQTKELKESVFGRIIQLETLSMVRKLNPLEDEELKSLIFIVEEARMTQELLAMIEGEQE